MNPKALIDLHCDTLTDCRPTPAGNPDTLDDPERVLSLSAMPEDVHWAQFYALFPMSIGDRRPSTILSRTGRTFFAR